MKKISMILLLLSFQVLAQQSNKTTLERVEVTEQFFTIYADSGDFGKQECDVGNPIAFYPDDFPTSYDTLLSTALTAFAAERPVTMWFSGCGARPWAGTQPQPTSLVIHKQ